MARKTKMIESKSEYEHTVEVECDLCHKKAPDPDDGEDVWTKEQYQLAQTTIEMKEGDNYPDGGEHEVVSFDICLTCFKTKLIPFFAKEGGSLPTVRKVEW